MVLVVYISQLAIRKFISPFAHRVALFHGQLPVQLDKLHTDVFNIYISVARKASRKTLLVTKVLSDKRSNHVFAL